MAQRGRRARAASSRRSRRTRSPSRRRAELRPGQLDTDSLPPYDVLDAILDDYVERRPGPRRPGRGRASTRRWSTGCSRLVDRAEYKRRQSPPGPKISVATSAATAGCHHQPLARAPHLTPRGGSASVSSQAAESPRQTPRTVQAALSDVDRISTSRDQRSRSWRTPTTWSSAPLPPLRAGPARASRSPT